MKPHPSSGSTSPGYDAGELLPNFSDGFTGIAPDVGAYEAAANPMEFGVNAHRNGPGLASPTFAGAGIRPCGATPPEDISRSPRDSA